MSASSPRDACALRTKVVEIVGPAGVGKSTLTHALCQQCDQAQAGISPQRISSVATFAAEMTRLVPAYLSGCLGTSWLSRNEMRAIYLLGGWRLQAQDKSASEVLAVMDHGPIFRLTYLRAFGPPLTRTSHFQRWWEEMLADWSQTLDTIVCLEADNEELIDRVRSRHGRSDRFQARSDTAAHQFLEDYRRGYDEILCSIARLGGPSVLTFNTQSQSPTEIADSVLSSLGFSTRSEATTSKQRP